MTSEHPLFTVGASWVRAGELAPGDVVRDSALAELRVLSVEVDSAPQRVHNLEVAGAGTYFAGELEAWGHNRWWKPGGGGKLQPYDTKTGRYVCKIKPKSWYSDLLTGSMIGYSDGSKAPPKPPSPFPPSPAGRAGYSCGSSLGIAERIYRFGKGMMD